MPSPLPIPPVLRLLAGALLLALAPLQLRPVHAQPHWPQFRGPNSQGVSASAQPPLHFSATSNMLWQTPLASGHSSPVIWGNRIFLTTHETGRLAVVALDRPTGTPAWQWSVPAGPTSDVHAASNPAAPSCAADARHAYAYFGSWGLAAFHHDGREAWRRPMPPPRNRYGMATSPVLHGNHVILVLDSDDTRSRIVAFQTADGTTAWETERPGQRATWSTPAIWTPPSGSNRPGADELIVLSAMRLAAYDPRDGRELWTLDGFPQETVSVPAIGRDLVYAGAAALGGRGDERYDAMGWKQLLAFDINADGRVQTAEIPDDFRLVLRPDLPREHPGYAIPFPFKRDFRSRDLDQDGALSESEWNESVLKWEASSRPVLMAVRPGSLPSAASPTIPPPGTATATSTDSPAAPGASPAHDRVAWKTTRGLPEMPSFLLHQERLFYVRDGGLLSCYEAGTGTLVYQERLGAPGQYCASPIAAGDRLYLASVDGVVTVVDTATPALRVLARNAVGGAIHATPALAENVLYLRTASHLIAFASPGTR